MHLRTWPVIAILVLPQAVLRLAVIHKNCLFLDLINSHLLRLRAALPMVVRVLDRLYSHHICFKSFLIHLPHSSLSLLCFLSRTMSCWIIFMHSPLRLVSPLGWHDFIETKCFFFLTGWRDGAERYESIPQEVRDDCPVQANLIKVYMPLLPYKSFSKYVQQV